MPELANALAFRLFGTRQLAVASGLRLAGIALLLSTLPSVLLFAAQELVLYVFFVGGLAALGLIVFILPGIFIALIGLWVGAGLVVLFVRGYLNLGIRSYNWLYTTYSLAQEDVALNAHFARQDSVEATNAPTPESELTQLHAQLADKEPDTLRIQFDNAQREIALLTGQLQTKDELIASKEETIELLKAAFTRPN